MKRLILLPLVAFALCACNSVFTDKVTISSTPAGADVYINGVLSGVTPLETQLDRDGTYEISIVKVGYKPQTQVLASTQWDPFVKFGPLVDLGYYKELYPSPLSAELKPVYLPDTVGTDPFGSMTYCILQADLLRKSGKISPEEHSYMITTITKFFSPQDDF